MTREIIVVQVGNVSNFVGAHWWNIQESSFVFNKEKANADETRLNHDVFFREGRNLKDQFTYSPRVIIVDDKDNVGSSSVLQCLYDYEPKAKQAHQAWAGQTVISHQTKPANEFLADLEFENRSSSAQGPPQVRVEEKFYNLDNCVQTWTDFLRVPLHPKSILTLSDISCDDSITRFDFGLNLTKESSIYDLIESKFRFFSEECDSLKGFHLLCDVHNAFSGVSSSVVEYLKDEFRSSTILCFPLVADHLFKKETFDWTNFFWNSSQILTDLATSCNLTFPLSLIKRWRKGFREFHTFDHLRYQPQLLYHTSSILASALETSSIPWRLAKNPDNLDDVCIFLTEDRRKLGHIKINSPFSINGLTTENIKRPSSIALYPVSPGIEENNEQISIENQPGRKFMVSMRGIKNLNVDNLPSSAPQTDKINRVSDLLCRYFEYESNRFGFCSTYEPLYTKSPFPNIFADYVDKNGILGKEKRARNEGVQSISTLCQMESSSVSYQVIRDIYQEISHFDYKKLNIDRDSFDLVKENLNLLKDN